MNRALIIKEWRQARMNVLGVTVAMSLLWVLAVEPELVLRPWWVRPDQTLLLQAVLSMALGLQLAVAQFASESIWRTRDQLVFRGSGPADAFGAKCAVGAVGTTLFVLVPVLVWGAWQRITFEASEIGMWGQLVATAQVGTLAWAGWGVGALACQLRRGWAARAVALLLGGAGTFGLAAVGTAQLASTPPWMDWMPPLASAALAAALAWGAGRAFVAGVDEDVPLRDGPGLALALGVTLALGFPLALVGPSASGFAERELRESYFKVVETEGGELALIDPDDWWLRTHWTNRDPSPKLLGDVTLVFDPWWMGWGWPDPDGTVRPVVRHEAFALGGAWARLTNSGPPRRALASYYDVRTREVHVLCDDSGGRWRRVHDLNGSSKTVLVPSRRSDRVAALADLEHLTLTLIRQKDGDVAVEPLELPDGDTFAGVERLVSRDRVEVGYEPPFHYENGLLLRGENGLYELGEHGLEPYLADPDDGSVAASLADELARYTTGYAVYDGLDPVIEVRDARSGERLLEARLAPVGAKTAGLKALAIGATFLHAPVLSLPSFLDDEPWRGGSPFENPALHGGRRAWLFGLQVVFAAWLALRVRRETRGWGRSPRLAGVWVAAVGLLGAVGWVLYRFCEPAPVRSARTERVEEPGREALAGVGAEA